MRSRGVTGFPDPGGTTPSDASISILGIVIPPTVDIRSPAFQSAMRACVKLITRGLPRQAVSEASKLAVLKFARCMRTHGVPTFPDPVFASNGMIGIGKGTNPSSPAFQQAQKACGSP
jgi:hypothetical protein